MDRAEEFYKKAIDADPDDANAFGNYAQVLLGRGRTADGLRVHSEAMSRNEFAGFPELDVELMFYGYAHAPATERRRYLQRLKVLLASGAKSEGWSFAVNVERATKIEKHPAKGWLAKLAAVCSGEADISTLDRWKTWRDA